MVKVGTGGSNINPLAYADQRSANVPIVPFKVRPTINHKKYALGTQAILQDATDPAQEGEIYQFSKVDSNGDAIWIQINDAGGGIPLPVDVPSGGTGQTTLTDNELLVGDGVSPVGSIANGTTGQVLTAQTGAEPTFSTLVAGDVDGPPSNTTEAIAVFSGNSGKLLRDSVGTLSNGGNLVITGTSSGNKSLARFVNTSNTANSRMNIQARTGGSLAGDPFISFSIEGVRTMAMGVDNSDDDAFKMTTGDELDLGSLIWKMDRFGQSTMPLQPCFLASLSANDLSVTGNGTPFVIGSGNPFTIITDQGSNFNVDGTFTAPVAGNYLLQYRFKLNNISGTIGFIFRVATNLQSYQIDTNVAAGVNVYSDSINVITPMLAGHVAIGSIAVSGLAGDTVDVISISNQTAFSGSLVC